MDFELNYRHLSPELHRGNYGPHEFRETNLMYKEQLERELRETLHKESYFIDEVIDILGLKEKQAHKAFKRVKRTSEGIAREDIIFRLMGNRFYL